MDEVREFEVEVTAARLAEAMPWLQRALQVQNARFAAAIDLSRHVGWLRAGGVVVSALSAIGCAVLGATSPHARSFARVGVVYFVAAIPIFAFAPQIRVRVKAWGRRVAGRQLLWVGERLLRQSFQLARYRVKYQATVPPGAPRPTEGGLVLSDFGFALSGPSAVFLFASQRGVTPRRIVLLPDAVETERLLHALREAGTLVEAIPEQAPPGYGPAERS